MTEEAEQQVAESEIVDRVAKALLENDPFPMARHLTDMYRGLARAAIAAMREPTAEMICAGGETLQEHVAMSMHAAVKCWVAMIDASQNAISASPSGKSVSAATTHPQTKRPAWSRRKTALRAM